ncbi:MAG: hypothetical protein JRE23_15940 [Deltaproteobacteria bacterium]|nr:hypothetical protein [Deltaproteobacteria bacterium]
MEFQGMFNVRRKYGFRKQQIESCNGEALKLHEGDIAVYGVRKSGPADSQTKFLIYVKPNKSMGSGGGWRWVWAHDFMPSDRLASITFIEE